MAPFGLILPLLGCALVLFELLLVKVLSVVLFGPQAHLAIALALLGGGIGASILHAYPSICSHQRSRSQLTCLLLIAAIFAVVSLCYMTQLPLTAVASEIPITFQERMTKAADLVNTPLLSGLLFLLTVPFIVGGIILAAAFKDSAHAPCLYARDLIGSALAAPVFLLLLTYLPATDCMLLVAALCLTAGSLVVGKKPHKYALLFASLALCLGGGSSLLTKHELFPVRYAAGYQESTMSDVRWTPTSRVSVFKNPFTNEESIVLDNGSASPVVQNENDERQMASSAARGLVYTLTDTGSAAIIGAGAGPEVAAAYAHGFRKILAIDLVEHVFEVLKSRYSSNPYSPFRNPEFRTRGGDGRSVIQKLGEKFQTIQIVHANIWSINGVLSNIWSPALLETTEAFHIFLDALTDDGILSVAKGPDTIRMISSAMQALRERGIAEQEIQKHIVFAHLGSTVLLIKPTPWNSGDLERIDAFAKKYSLPKKFLIHPDLPIDDRIKAEIDGWPVMTDDKPYSDTPLFLSEFTHWILSGKNKRLQDRTISDAPLAYLYSIFALQLLIVCLLGLIVIFLPLLLVRSSKQKRRPRFKDALYYFSVGFGFIALELTVMSRLVHLVVEPIVAVAATICGFLFFAGLGSLWVWRMSIDRVQLSLQRTLCAALAVAGVTFFVAIPAFSQLSLSSHTATDFMSVLLLSAPLAFCLGMPLVSYHRLIANDTFLVDAPWLWGVNCWASVLGSFASIFIARFLGYSVAFATGCAMYGIALLIVRSQRRSDHSIV